MPAFPHAVRPERTLSVSPAASRGVAGLVKDAELGEDIIFQRSGRSVDAVISVTYFDELHSLRADLIAASLILARELSDTGSRAALDDAIAGFGFDGAELAAELDVPFARLAATRRAREGLPDTVSCRG